MRDEDSDRKSGDDLPIDEDVDFDPITGGRSESLDDEKSDVSEDSDEAFERLRDKLISTVNAESIQTSSKSVSANVLTEQATSIVQGVGITDSVTTKDTRSVESSARLTSAVQPDQNSTVQNNAKPSRHSVPDHVRTVGTITNYEHDTHQVTNRSQLEESTVEQTDTVGTTRSNTFRSDNRSTTNIMTLDQTNTGDRPEQEIEEFDPAYDWSGGTPYGTTTPQCIIHIDTPDSESLPFLQRVLRDTYTELEGGRPRTKTMSVQAGKLEEATIHGAIVTLDLAAEQWTVSTDNQQIAISHDDREMVSQLQSTISDLYAGKLGYFVININQDDLQSRFLTNENKELINTLLDQPDFNGSHLTSDELLQRSAAPIHLAVPRHQTQPEFKQIIEQYFCFDQINHSRVAAIEASYEARLRANDWRRIALTQQQEGTDGESDEHYLWKAAITAGIAWHMYEEYTVLEEEISFNKFIQTQLIPTGPIQTEVSDESDNSPIPDLQIDTSDVWAWNGFRSFNSPTKLEPPKDSKVIIEFETGRAQGAFDFRKIHHTLEKYDEESDLWVYVVVLPRMLFSSKSRANMINQLVEQWSSSRPSNQQAELCIPVVGEYGCENLHPVESLMSDWFGDNND